MRDYLLDMRTEKAMSQQRVADKLGCTRQYYQQVEHGERQRDISLDLLIKLSEVFGEPLDKLIEAERDYKASIAQ
mgnify:CR=1 FL=1